MIWRELTIWCDHEDEQKRSCNAPILIRCQQHITLDVNSYKEARSLAKLQYGWALRKKHDLCPLHSGKATVPCG